MWNNNYQVYRTNKFQEIWESASSFVEDYKESEIPQTITDENATTLYYLLYSKYGNNPIASSDENRFKYAVWTTIFKYGATWQKRLDIQEKLRNLTDDELISGAKSINNHAYNPGTAPSTGTLDELTAINEQNTVNYKKSKLDAYGMLMSLLETDVTEEFLGKFKSLFNPFLLNRPLVYKTELKEGEIQ